jgi:hypothetical protein
MSLVCAESRADFTGSVQLRRSHCPRVKFVAFEVRSFGSGDLHAESESRPLIESADQRIDVVTDLDGRCVKLLRRLAFA